MQNTQSKSVGNPVSPSTIFVSSRFAGMIPLADLLEPYSASLPPRAHNAVITAWDRILRGLHHDHDPAIDLISRRLIDARASMDAATWQRIRQKFEANCYV